MIWDRSGQKARPGLSGQERPARKVYWWSGRVGRETSNSRHLGSRPTWHGETAPPNRTQTGSNSSKQQRRSPQKAPNLSRWYSGTREVRREQRESWATLPSLLCQRHKSSLALHGSVSPFVIIVLVSEMIFGDRGVPCFGRCKKTTLKAVRCLIKVFPEILSLDWNWILPFSVLKKSIRNQPGCLKLYFKHVLLCWRSWEGLH